MGQAPANFRLVLEAQDPQHGLDTATLWPLSSAFRLFHTGTPPTATSQGHSWQMMNRGTDNESLFLRVTATKKRLITGQSWTTNVERSSQAATNSTVLKRSVETSHPIAGPRLTKQPTDMPKACQHPVKPHPFIPYGDCPSSESFGGHSTALVLHRLRIRPVVTPLLRSLKIQATVREFL